MRDQITVSRLLQRPTQIRYDKKRFELSKNVSPKKADSEMRM